MELKNKKVLITCGPTCVPIDEMRVISNRSSGALGHTAAYEFARQKADVTLLEGPVAEPLKNKKINILKFFFYDELSLLLKEELKKKYDIVVHAAAVSDYKLKKTFKGKLSSGCKDLSLELTPTAKLIGQIKKIDPKVFLVGFKLEKITTELSAKKDCGYLFKKAKCDLVIANSIKANDYFGLIMNNTYDIMAESNSRERIIKELIKIINNK